MMERNYYYVMIATLYSKSLTIGSFYFLFYLPGLMEEYQPNIQKRTTTITSVDLVDLCELQQHFGEYSAFKLELERDIIIAGW